MKTSIFIVCTAFLLACLSGCAAKEANSYTQETFLEIVTESPSSEEASVSSETALNTTYEHPLTVIIEENEFHLPPQKFADNTFKDNIGEYNILYFPDGTYQTLTEAELQELYNADYGYTMMSEEYFNDNFKDDGGYDSYEDYKDKIKSVFNIDDDYKPLEYSLLITIGCVCYEDYDENEAPERHIYVKAAFNYLIRKISENAFPEISKIISSGDRHTINIIGEIKGDNLCLNAYFLRNEEYELQDLFKDKFISLNGEELISVCGAAIPPNTVSLYITSEKDAEAAEMWNGYSPEGYDCVLYHYLDELDISALADAFPDLERLFIDIQKVLYKNPQGFAEFKNLSELNFNFDEDTEGTGWLGKISAEKLILRKIAYAPTGLSECKSETIIVECSTDDWLIESISACENIDELTLYSRFVPDNPDFTKIASMKGLKKLTLKITDDDKPLDLSTLESSDSFEELEIITYREITADSLSKIKNLRSLSLKQIGNRDFSFLKETNALESLTLSNCYMPDSHFTGIYSLPSLKKLAFIGMSVNFEEISRAENLSSLSVKDCSTEYLEKISECRKLSFLNIEDILDGSIDAENLETFENLENLRLSDVSIYHYDSLKKLDKLKRLELIDVGITEDQLNDLRRALPSCEIIAEGLSEFSAASHSQPETSEMIGSIRVERYKISDPYWNKHYILKNTGTDTIDNILDFIAENGILEGSTDMIVTYSDEKMDTREIIKIIDGAPDYDSSQIFVSAFNSNDKDSLENGEFRKLEPGMKVTFLLSDKTD
ncbi:MAG: hypothetical protein IJF18_00255 [Oscillospiraceae bacterium]|nr:hypothetical protein [Oscillospiraceae bacterium]